ncbi:unnamed protein product [Withania somnifera]
MILPSDPANKLSFKRCIKDGGLVIVSEDGVLQNRFGASKHSEWIGKPFGSKVLSNKGAFVYLLAPTPELWTLSFLVVSGTGSGSLTTSLARAVAPSGHVYTFDFHEQRAASAREDFEKTELSNLVTVGADSVFLDLPQPWLAVPSAGNMLKPGGVLCSFSPCIEQVQRSCEVLKSNFTDIRTFEVLLRTYEVRRKILESCPLNEGDSIERPLRKRREGSAEGSNGTECSFPTVMLRPSGEARGHTGHLTFARLV